MNSRQNKQSPAVAKANAFLTIANQFRLGDLITEEAHPKTQKLSQLSKTDLSKAIRVLQEVDCDSLRVLLGKTPEILQLASSIQSTLSAGHRVFFVGCGATGRLSLSLETLWRETLDSQHPWNDSVRSFMAGGDFALIRSIENFEDHPSYGAQMLEESGFAQGDLLIASTEGGETPYVIGAALHAPSLSNQKHWFLFCNPPEILIPKLERSREALLCPSLQKMNLTVGPMALSGSTRMQASTVLMLAAGTALFEALRTQVSFDSIEEQLEAILNHYGSSNLDFLADFITHESAIYRKSNNVIYKTNDYGITVITDTTERSPTFSFDVFENRLDAQRSPSLSYICIPSATTGTDAWNKILHRPARPLKGWSEYENIAGPNRINGYDFSSSVVEWRINNHPQVAQHIFEIFRGESSINFSFEQIQHKTSVDGLSLLNEHILLKMLLNIHSTLVMGRLERFQGNVMTCVRPSNFKLIDRSIRYVQHLLQQDGMVLSYEDVCLQCFVELETAKVNEPVVLKTYEALKLRQSEQLNLPASGGAPRMPPKMMSNIIQ